jgi:hypothetical protein
MRVPLSPHPHHHLLFLFLMIAIVTGVRQNINMVLICISFIVRDGEHFFMCFLPISNSTFEKSLFNSFAHFGHCFLGFRFLSFLCILVVNLLPDLELEEIFSHSMGSLFVLATIVVQKLF